MPLVFECTAHGAVGAAQLGPLQALLQGLSEQGARPVDLLEVVLRGPAEGKGAAQELRCRRDRAAPAAGAGVHSWRVRTEGPVLRGAQVKDLPATLRPLTEAEFEGDALAFWGRLGYSEAFRFFKEGTAYLLSQAGHTVQVELATVRRCAGEERDFTGDELAPGATLVGALAIAPEGQHLQAAKAIGAVAALLRPLVDLQKE